MKDRLTTDWADSERLKEMQRVSDPPPLRHVVILILKKTKLAGFPIFEGLPKASDDARDTICALEAAT
jgi:hypothetical protein